MSLTIDFQNRDDLNSSQLSHQDMDWLEDSKHAALNKFKSARLPGRKVEHWKYNKLAYLWEQAYQLAPSPADSDVARISDLPGRIPLKNTIELVFVDGFLTTCLDDLPAIHGVSFTAFEHADARQQALILKQQAADGDNRNLFIDLNHAINQNGLLVEVDADHVVTPTIYCRYFVSTAQTANIASHQLLVCLGRSSELKLVEHFESEVQQQTQLSLQQTSVELAANSHLQHYRFNLEHQSNSQISQTRMTLSKDANISSFYLGLGGLLNRTDIDVIHAGENAHCQVTGIYLPAGSQAIDYHSNTEHRVAHCSSNEVFRGIIADQASATFNGKIHIFQDAQKSDAYLNNKNLLLPNKKLMVAPNTQYCGALGEAIHAIKED